MTKILGVDGKPIEEIVKTSKREILDMSAEAIDRREAQEDLKKRFEAKWQSYWFKVNPVQKPKKIQRLEDFKPLHDMVLCEPQADPSDMKTESGIITQSVAEAKKQEDVINDAIAFQVIKVGAEVVNVRAGDYAFQGMKSTPLLIPLMCSETEEVRSYRLFSESWLGGVLRSDYVDVDFIHSAVNKNNLLNA